MHYRIDVPLQDTTPLGLIEALKRLADVTEVREETSKLLICSNDAEIREELVQQTLDWCLWGLRPTSICNRQILGENSYRAVLVWRASELLVPRLRRHPWVTQVLIDGNSWVIQLVNLAVYDLFNVWMDQLLYQDMELLFGKQPEFNSERVGEYPAFDVYALPYDPDSRFAYTAFPLKREALEKVCSLVFFDNSYSLECSTEDEEALRIELLRQLREYFGEDADNLGFPASPSQPLTFEEELEMSAWEEYYQGLL